MTFIPQAITTIDGNDHLVDPISLTFIRDRCVFLYGEVNDESVLLVISQLRFLDSKSDRDIILIINSPGGSVSSGLALYDVINDLSSDVVTIGNGIAASMGAFLLAAGTKGKRYITQSSEVMIHQPLGGVQGQATDISLVADHIQKVKGKLAWIMAENCGKDVSTVTSDMERDFWMSAIQAKEYGLVDHVGFPDYT